MRSRLGEWDLMHHVPELDLDHVESDLHASLIEGGAVGVAIGVGCGRFGIWKCPGNADVEVVGAVGYRRGSGRCPVCFCF